MPTVSAGQARSMACCLSAGLAVDVGARRASNKVLHQLLSLYIAFASAVSADQLFIQFLESDLYPMVRFELTIINQEGGLGRLLQGCHSIHGESQESRSTGGTFRSYDLRVMSPARFLCATPVGGKKS